MEAYLCHLTLAFSVILFYTQGCDGRFVATGNQLVAASPINSNTTDASLTLPATAQRKGTDSTFTNLPSSDKNGSFKANKLINDKSEAFSEKIKDFYHSIFSETTRSLNNTLELSSHYNYNHVSIGTNKILNKTTPLRSSSAGLSKITKDQRLRSQIDEHSKTTVMASIRDTASMTYEDLPPSEVLASTKIKTLGTSFELPDVVEIIEQNRTDELNIAANTKRLDEQLVRAEIVGIVCILLGIVVLLVTAITAMLMERRRRCTEKSQVALLWTPPFEPKACNSTLYSWSCDVIQPGWKNQEGNRLSYSGDSVNSETCDGLSNNVFRGVLRSSVQLSPTQLLWFKGKGLERTGSLPEP